MMPEDELRYRRQVQACLRSWRAAIEFEQASDHERFKQLRIECAELIRLVARDEHLDRIATALNSIAAEMMGSPERRKTESDLQQLRFSLSDIFAELDSVGNERFPESRAEMIRTFSGITPPMPR